MLPGWEEKFFLRTKEKTQLSDSSYTSLRFGEIFKIIICFNYIPKMKKEDKWIAQSSMFGFKLY